MPASLPDSDLRHSLPLTNLGSDETVVVFPSLGHLEHDGLAWHVSIHGEVFGPGQVSIGKRILLKLLQRAMKAPQCALQTDIFQQRIARFLAHDRAGRKIVLRVGEEIHSLPKASRRNGHFIGALRLAADAAPQPAGSACGSLLIDVCGPDGEKLVASGQVFLVPSQGLSVISDIDDTLKHTYVGCKQTLLASTFLKEFEPVAGMADLFRDWARQGAAFHYVSSSPWQLYRHLADHFQAEGFPEGSFHLRSFRLRDHLIRRILLLRRSGKAAVIRNILKTFPQRRFLLVGDSGEADPEIYGSLARKFPRQVARVLIRQLNGPRDNPARYQKAFRGVRYEVVRLFRDAAELSGDVTLAEVFRSEAARI
jgi:phosphatidate phosphatase APP1